jgi:hypothetical protein
MFKEKEKYGTRTSELEHVEDMQVRSTNIPSSQTEWNFEKNWLKRNKMYKRMHLNVRPEKEKIPWRLVQNEAYRNGSIPVFILITNG